jgi:hypothetical protein
MYVYICMRIPGVAFSGLPNGGFAKPNRAKQKIFTERNELNRVATKRYKSVTLGHKYLNQNIS